MSGKSMARMTSARRSAAAKAAWDAIVHMLAATTDLSKQKSRSNDSTCESVRTNGNDGKIGLMKSLRQN